MPPRSRPKIFMKRDPRSSESDTTVKTLPRSNTLGRCAFRRNRALNFGQNGTWRFLLQL